MPITILDKVSYRIQSVDYGTFLQRRDDEALVMRPDKPGNIAQEWFIEKSPQDSSLWVIKSADPAQQGRLRVENIKTSVVQGDTLGTLALGSQTDSSSPYQWSFIETDPELVQPNVYMKLFGAGNKDILLEHASADKLVISRDSNYKSRNWRGDENFQWRIVESKPANLPQPDGDPIYRIRTLNGENVHVEKTQLAIMNQGRGDHREWKIVSKGNGKCTIYNEHNKLYLNAGQNSDGHWITNFTQTSADWDIQKNSDFTYTITIVKSIISDGKKHNQRLGLAVKEKIVILKPYKEAHNQIWLIELSDANLGPTEETTDNPDQVAQDLAAGSYLLKSAAFGDYIRLMMNAAQGTGVAKFAAGSPTSKNKFTITKSGDRAVLSCTIIGSTTRWIGIKNGQVTCETSEVTVKVESGPSKGQYYVTDGNGNAITSKNEQDLIVTQKGNGSLWIFEKRD